MSKDALMITRMLSVTKVCECHKMVNVILMVSVTKLVSGFER